MQDIADLEVALGGPFSPFLDGVIRTGIRFLRTVCTENTPNAPLSFAECQETTNFFNLVNWKTAGMSRDDIKDASRAIVSHFVMLIDSMGQYSTGLSDLLKDESSLVADLLEDIKLVNDFLLANQ
jgi:hypothetical protein